MCVPLQKWLRTSHHARVFLLNMVGVKRKGYSLLLLRASWGLPEALLFLLQCQASSSGPCACWTSILPPLAYISVLKASCLSREGHRNAWVGRAAVNGRSSWLFQGCIVNDVESTDLLTVCLVPSCSSWSEFSVKIVSTWESWWLNAWCGSELDLRRTSDPWCQSLFSKSVF